MSISEETKSRRKRDFEGVEKEHSLSVGNQVRIEVFGGVRTGVITELVTDAETGLPAYQVESGGIKYSNVGFFDHPHHGVKMLEKMI